MSYTFHKETQALADIRGELSELYSKLQDVVTSIEEHEGNSDTANDLLDDLEALQETFEDVERVGFEADSDLYETHEEELPNQFSEQDTDIF